MHQRARLGNDRKRTKPGWTSHSGKNAGKNGNGVGKSPRKNPAIARKAQ